MPWFKMHHLNSSHLCPYVIWSTFDYTKPTQSVSAERTQLGSQSKPKPTALLEPKDDTSVAANPEQFPLELVDAS